MRIWLPCVRGGSGTDIYTERLALGLERIGEKVSVQYFSHYYQYFPWLLRTVSAPKGTDIIVANSWNAFAFARPESRLVVVNHLCVFDSVLSTYKSFSQNLFHKLFLRRFERWGYNAADAAVAVSQYTAEKVEETFDGVKLQAIYNGIDTEFFSPAKNVTETDDTSLFKILFVGNLSRRKGVDLLPKIMNRLGSNYHLYYTSGLNDSGSLNSAPNFHALGSLNQSQMKAAYQNADIVLFPTRAEGFGYAAVEAMGCGKPVVASNTTSLPEIVKSGETGFLCACDDVEGFVSTIKMLKKASSLRREIGINARAEVVNRFSIDLMTQRYMDVFACLVEGIEPDHPN